MTTPITPKQFADSLRDDRDLEAERADRFLEHLERKAHNAREAVERWQRGEPSGTEPTLHHQDLMDANNTLVAYVRLARLSALADRVEGAVQQEPETLCGGCGDVVDPTEERCPRCGFPDGDTMISKGYVNSARKLR